MCRLMQCVPNAVFGGQIVWGRWRIGGYQIAWVAADASVNGYLSGNGRVGVPSQIPGK